MSKISIYCVTNVELKYLEELNLNLAGVGTKIQKNYVTALRGKNIQHKEKLF